MYRMPRRHSVIPFGNPDRDRAPSPIVRATRCEECRRRCKDNFRVILPPSKNTGSMLPSYTGKPSALPISVPLQRFIGMQSAIVLPSPSGHLVFALPQQPEQPPPLASANAQLDPGEEGLHNSAVAGVTVPTSENTHSSTSSSTVVAASANNQNRSADASLEAVQTRKFAEFEQRFGSVNAHHHLDGSPLSASAMMENGGRTGRRKANKVAFGYDPQRLPEIVHIATNLQRFREVTSAKCWDKWVTAKRRSQLLGQSLLLVYPYDIELSKDTLTREEIEWAFNPDNWVVVRALDPPDFLLVPTFRQMEIMRLSRELNVDICFEDESKEQAFMTQPICRLVDHNSKPKRLVLFWMYFRFYTLKQEHPDVLFIDLYDDDEIFDNISSMALFKGRPKRDGDSSEHKGRRMFRSLREEFHKHFAHEGMYLPFVLG